MLGATHYIVSKQEPSVRAINEMPALESRRVLTQPRNVTSVDGMSVALRRDLMEGDWLIIKSSYG